MPPLATLFLGVIALLFCSRALAAANFKSDLKQLPFIADITHGICPKCGDTHPQKKGLQEDHDLFWQAFKCRCGYSINVHLR